MKRGSILIIRLTENGILIVTPLLEQKLQFGYLWDCLSIRKSYLNYFSTFIIYCTKRIRRLHPLIQHYYPPVGLMILFHSSYLSLTLSLSLSFTLFLSLFLSFSFTPLTSLAYSLSPISSLPPTSLSFSLPSSLPASSIFLRHRTLQYSAKQ